MDLAQDYQPYFKYNGKDVLFSEAKTILHKRYDTGIGFGLVSHYENFEQVPELCFETYIWIELSTGDVHFEWIRSQSQCPAWTKLCGRVQWTLSVIVKIGIRS